MIQTFDSRIHRSVSVQQRIGDATILLVSTKAPLTSAPICENESSDKGKQTTTASGTFIGDCIKTISHSTSKRTLDAHTLCKKYADVCRKGTASNPNTPARVRNTASGFKGTVGIVFIDQGSGQSDQGSGVIIRKNNKEYTIATNEHVGGNFFQSGTFTINGTSYPIKKREAPQCPYKINQICPVDVALLYITTSDSLPVATIHRGSVSDNASVEAIGYPYNSKSISILKGTIKQVRSYPNAAFERGQTIGYTSDVESGMSGGGIFLKSTGTLIGLNANRKGASVFNGTGPFKNLVTKNPYSKEDIKQFDQLSWGLSVDTLCTIFPTACPATSNTPLATKPTLEVNPPLQQPQIPLYIETVGQIYQGSSRASGVIVQRRKKNNAFTYIIVTNEHVVNAQSEKPETTSFRIQNKNYPATLIKPVCPYPDRLKPEKVRDSTCAIDLALLEITTPDILPVAKLQMKSPAIGAQVAAVGFPYATLKKVFRDGAIQYVRSFPNEAFDSGETIGYTSDVEQGMSGGGIFLKNTGELIGFNMRSAYPIFPRYEYLIPNNNTITASDIKAYKAVSWGMSLQALCSTFPTVLSAVCGNTTR